MDVQLSVTRSVVVDMVRLAGQEVPGVLRLGRRGPRWRALLLAGPVAVRMRNGVVDVRLTVIARPGHRLVAVTSQTRAAVASAIERLLGLEVGAITIVVDGVGG